MKFNTFMFQNQQVMEAELIEEKAIPKGAFDAGNPVEGVRDRFAR